MSIIRKISFDSALSFLLPALFFVTPLSSSAKSILLGLIVATILMNPKSRQDFKSLYANKLCLTALLIFIFASLGCLWSHAALSEKLLVLEKWSKLLYLPFLIIGLNNKKTRQASINAFIFAMLITCLLSIYIYFTGHLQVGKTTADGVFRNHIMTGIMMSFATYLSMMLFLQSANAARIFYLVTSLLYSYQILFINESRTGYIVYFLLMALLIARSLSFRKAFVGLVSLGIIFVLCCYLSNPMWSRIKLVHAEYSSYKQDKNTPIGYRMQFHAYAEELFQRHPIIGNGTGSFTYLFKTENPVPAWTSDLKHSGRLLEPHSQYWLVASELGSLGLILMALFYLELLIRFYSLGSMRPAAFALFLVLVTGNLTDSLLFYSGSGYFFLMFFALFLGEKASEPVVIQSLKDSFDNKLIKGEYSTN